MQLVLPSFTAEIYIFALLRHDDGLHEHFVIREDEEREVLRAVGTGTPRNVTVLISPLELEVDILV
jgi:hypothetical protein